MVVSFFVACGRFEMATNFYGKGYVADMFS